MIEKPPEYSSADMLNAVKAAIYKITTAGQSYKLGSRSLTYADLGELRAYLRDLEAQPEERSDFFGNFVLSKHIRR